MQEEDEAVAVEVAVLEFWTWWLLMGVDVNGLWVVKHMYIYIYVLNWDDDNAAAAVDDDDGDGVDDCDDDDGETMVRRWQ